MQAIKRKTGERQELRRVREADQIPAVFYGKNTANIPISVDRSHLLDILKKRGKSGIFLLELDGNKEKVVVIDYQRDPLTKGIRHVDFMSVDENTEIETDIPVVLIGEAYGVKDGGVLQQSLHTVSVAGRPAVLPEAIKLDIGDLKVRETIYIKDIRDRFPFLINHRDEEVIASILPPKQEEEISTGEEQEPGIPENLEGRETHELED